MQSELNNFSIIEEKYKSSFLLLFNEMSIVLENYKTILSSIEDLKLIQFSEENKENYQSLVDKIQMRTKANKEGQDRVTFNYDKLMNETIDIKSKYKILNPLQVNAFEAYIENFEASFHKFLSNCTQNLVDINSYIKKFIIKEEDEEMIREEINKSILEARNSMVDELNGVLDDVEKNLQNRIIKIENLLANQKNIDYGAEINKKCILIEKQMKELEKVISSSNKRMSILESEISSKIYSIENLLANIR